MGKGLLLWVLAGLVTLASAAYQRATGPTYPQKVRVQIGENVYPLRLPRSHGGPGDVSIRLHIPDPTVTGRLRYRRYPTAEPWRSAPLVRKGETLTGALPHQPPAGKLAYTLELRRGGRSLPTSLDDHLVVIRFKGAVPASIVVPHVLLMFTAMWLSNLAGLFALVRSPRQRIYARLTLVALLLGGMILGPLMQAHAFGEYWTGVPFGWDLTDNKTLIAFMAWAVAVAGNWRRERPVLTLLAAAVTLVIFLIPHSMFGSELDPATGQIRTG